MSTQSSSTMSLLERFHRAMNQHDLEAFVACFASDYDSKQPIYPDRAFVGTDQVRKNWSHMFEDVPDFRGDLLRSTIEADIIWTEWDWHGTQKDGASFQMVAAIIFGVRDDRFTWGRLYLESVEAAEH